MGTNLGPAEKGTKAWGDLFEVFSGRKRSGSYTFEKAGKGKGKGVNRVNNKMYKCNTKECINVTAKRVKMEPKWS